ncbi:MAG: hypothetical protein K2Q22_11275, partial [Cytophagales bacterium]|nr:hypothetical protein [Cytophagales bacterium]
MRANIYFVSFLSISLTFNVLKSSYAQEKPKTVDIDALISKMTLEEKVGQMMNLTLTTLTKENSEPAVLDSAKMHNVLISHYVGNIQNVTAHAYTLSEWHTIVNTIQRIALKGSKNKIPMMYCIDAVHGTNYT